MKNEHDYSFRTDKYNQLRECRRNMELSPSFDELELKDGVCLVIARESGEVLKQAAADFVRFLLDGMLVSAQISYSGSNRGNIYVQIDESYGSYKCFKIVTSLNGIMIVAHDERGAQQALFDLEFRMLDRRAPFIKEGETERVPLFSPRMVQSGYAKGNYPDIHLREIARAGLDAIIIEYSDCETSGGIIYDFNDLVYRAGRYGIDVYLYSMIRCPYTLKDERSLEFYDQAYGEMFHRFPDIKGVVVVSETSGIKSSDPNASPCNYAENYTDGIPNHKPSSDFWPCMDYAEWIDMLKDIIRKHKKDADIIFWTYNFLSAPEKYRLQLIDALPTDISLLVTLGNGEKISLNGKTHEVSDYSLAVSEGGRVFDSEAAEAKKKGIRLYAMSNTGGRTWDFGVLPYEPMPQQWIARYRSLREAKKKWNLCGLMESHHYGFWPSFISEMAREAFQTPYDDKDILSRVLKRNFGDECANIAEEALELWSRAIQKITPTPEDQWGAFRTGPSYPFNLINSTNIPMEKTDAFVGFYTVYYNADYSGGNTPSSIRIDDEICSLNSMLEDIRKGIGLLESVSESCEELNRLINLGKFMACCVLTGIHAKEWFNVRTALLTEKEPSKAIALCDAAEKLLLREKENATSAIPFAMRDSRLGYEPNMGYVCSPQKLEWKLRQIDFILESELPALRNGITGQDGYRRSNLPFTISHP